MFDKVRGVIDEGVYGDGVVGVGRGLFREEGEEGPIGFYGLFDGADPIVDGGMGGAIIEGSDARIGEGEKLANEVVGDSAGEVDVEAPIVGADLVEVDGIGVGVCVGNGVARGEHHELGERKKAKFVRSGWGVVRRE
jgi:hypothetical protein